MSELPTGPTRPFQLPNEHPSITAKAWIVVEDTAHDFYVRVGRRPDDASLDPSRPLEIFLTPRGAVKCGSMLAHYAAGVGESLSLLLQHGHTPGQLFRRYKKGSLEKNAMHAFLLVALQEGYPLDEESTEIAVLLTAHMQISQQEGGKPGPVRP